MPDKKFSELDAASLVAADDVFALETSAGASKKIAGSVVVPISVSSFSFTATEIKSGVALEMAPSPGAGKTLIPIGGIIVAKFGSVPFPSDTSIFEFGAIGVQQSNLWSQTSDQSLHLGSPEGQSDLADIEDAPYTVTTHFPGAISAASVSSTGAGGSGYAVDDTGTISSGDGNATYKILTVDGGGAVLTFEVTDGGTSYATNTDRATSTGGAQPGIGVNFFVDITAIDPTTAPGDGSAYGHLLYAVQNIV